MIVDEEAASRMEKDEFGFRSPFRTPRLAAHVERPVPENESPPTKSEKMEQHFEVGKADVDPKVATNKVEGVSWVLGSPPTPRDPFKTPLHEG